MPIPDKACIIWALSWWELQLWTTDLVLETQSLFLVSFKLQVCLERWVSQVQVTFVWKLTCFECFVTSPDVTIVDLQSRCALPHPPMLLFGYDSHRHVMFPGWLVKNFSSRTSTLELLLHTLIKALTTWKAGLVISLEKALLIYQLVSCCRVFVSLDLRLNRFTWLLAWLAAV